jgi:hypothetical protein
MPNDLRKNWLIDRRTCLKGLGVALALPLLESMGWAESPATGATAKPWKPPVRLGFMYMPHGVIMDRFWPKDAESFRKDALPPIIASLAPVIDRCLMVKGISGIPIAPFNGAPHALELSTWLTATLPDADRRASIHIGISADQIAANYVGGMTALPSLELATMPQTHKENQEGLNENYYSHCSFRSPTQPVPAEVNPGAVFRRLFQGRAQGPEKDAQALSSDGALDRSLLDLVLGGAKDLRGRLGRSDQQKIDEYLDGVRALERRIAAIEHREREGDKAGTERRQAGDSPLIEIAIPDGDVKGRSPEASQFVRRSTDGESEVKRSEYMQVMCDLTVLAFQADITRVSTYIGSTPNGASYPELGFSDQHHSQTHYGTDQVKIDKVAKINALNVEQFAYMVQKMANLKEGAGTLLDNCIMMWGSGLEDGDKHERKNLPFVIAGKGGGTLDTGRFITDVKGTQGDLLGTLLTAAGIPLDRPIGIGTKVITQMLKS